MKGKLQFKGRYKIIKEKDGQETWNSGWINNIVTDVGLQLIISRLGGTFGNTMQIDEARLGTGSTAANVADTALETPVVTNILVASSIVTTKLITLDFFLPDVDVPDGTYTEFGLFCSGVMFTRSIISPSFIKDSGENTIINYEINVDQA